MRLSTQRLNRASALAPPSRRARRLNPEVGELEGRLLLSVDTTAPVTRAVVVAGRLGTNHFYTTPVTIALKATDPDDAPSTLTTFYKVDRGGYVQGNTVRLGNGDHTVRFYSVDPAGNVGPTGVLTVDIDTTAPRVTASASPTTLWPPNNKFVAVTVTGHVSDASGGVPRTVSYRVQDEYGRAQPSGIARVNARGDYSFVVFLEASRLGQDKDGRQYTIVVKATDQAGNSGSASTHVTVPHDQGHHNGTTTVVVDNDNGKLKGKSKGKGH